MKTRVLFINETSVLNTGYSVYGREVMRRLHSNPNIELAELAVYLRPDQPERHLIPWKYYFNTPNNEEESRRFESNFQNQFGAFRFEEVCLDFKPHVVMAIRDNWMDNYILTSPFRPYYNFVWMPTVDAERQDESWLSDYSQADGVFTYQGWSGQQLLKEAGGNVAYLGPASPAAAPEYKPYENREELKEKLGLADKFIIGTVMRNQRRKLYPDLFFTFKSLLEETGRNDIFLHCHVSYPDLGWDIPKLLMDNQVASKVLFTYVCTECKNTFHNFFSDAMTFCNRCNMKTAGLANVHVGATNETMASLYNMFDVYVQYSNCLPPGQLIRTVEGYKDIEDVTVGDSVLTHKGRFKRVVKTFVHENNNDVYEIGIHGDYQTLQLTAEHPVLAITKNDISQGQLSLREYLGNLLRAGQKIPQPDFVEAKSLEPGDMIATPISPIVHDYDIIDIINQSKLDLSDYIIDDHSYRHKKSKVTHQRKISINEQFCRWLGLFVADGNITCTLHGGSVRVTSANHETSNHQLCHEVMKNFGNVRMTGYRNRQAINHEFSNKLLAFLLKKYCYTSEKQKRLPQWCMFLDTVRQQNILTGLCMGDGHYSSDRNVTVYVTISEILALQIKELVIRCGLTYNLRKVIKSGNRQPQYRFEIRGDIANGKFDTDRQSTRSLNVDGYYFYQIKSKDKIEYSGKVYNFEVEDDNSYVAQGLCTHNSEGFGMPMVEAACCGVPVIGTNYSSMVDVLPKIGGYGIQVASKEVEIETGCYRATPSVEHTLQLIKNVLDAPKHVRQEQRQRAAYLARQNYNWDDTARKWEEYILNVDTQKYENAWHRKPKIHVCETDPPDGSNVDFARWLITDVLDEPRLLNSYFEARLIRDLNYHASTESIGDKYFTEMSSLFTRIGHKPFTREIAFNKMMNLCNIRNHWEYERGKRLGL